MTHMDHTRYLLDKKRRIDEGTWDHRAEAAALQRWRDHIAGGSPEQLGARQATAAAEIPVAPTAADRASALREEHARVHLIVTVEPRVRRVRPRPWNWIVAGRHPSLEWTELPDLREDAWQVAEGTTASGDKSYVAIDARGNILPLGVFYADWPTPQMLGRRQVSGLGVAPRVHSAARVDAGSIRRIEEPDPNADLVALGRRNGRAITTILKAQVFGSPISRGTWESIWAPESGGIG